jgi:hypothetical protein
LDLAGDMKNVWIRSIHVRRYSPHDELREVRRKTQSCRSWNGNLPHFMSVHGRVDFDGIRNWIAHEDFFEYRVIGRRCGISISCLGGQPNEEIAWKWPRHIRACCGPSRSAGSPRSGRLRRRSRRRCPAPTHRQQDERTKPSEQAAGGTFAAVPTFRMKHESPRCIRMTANGPDYSLVINHVDSCLAIAAARKFVWQEFHWPRFDPACGISFSAKPDTPCDDQI